MQVTFSSTKGLKCILIFKCQGWDMKAVMQLALKKKLLVLLGKAAGGKLMCQDIMQQWQMHQDYADCICRDKHCTFWHPCYEFHTMWLLSKFIACYKIITTHSFQSWVYCTHKTARSILFQCFVSHTACFHSCSRQLEDCNICDGKNTWQDMTEVYSRRVSKYCFSMRSQESRSLLLEQQYEPEHLCPYIFHHDVY